MCEEIIEGYGEVWVGWRDDGEGDDVWVYEEYVLMWGYRGIGGGGDRFDMGVRI